MLINNDNYFEILENVKVQIQNAQYKAVLGANRELILLYWNIGNVIIENSVWGNKFIDNLARDIKLEFPNAKGYSVRNLKYMRKFAEFITDVEIVPTLSAQLSWSHNRHLLDKAKTLDEYAWYARQTIENGKRYIDEYLLWLSEPEIASILPFTMEMLGRWKIPEARTLFMKHVDSGREDSIVFTSIKALAYYNDEEAREKILAMQNCENKDIRECANKVAKKLK